jgi:hypothetical protein
LDPREPYRCVPIRLQSFVEPGGIKTVLEYDGKREHPQSHADAKLIPGEAALNPIVTSAEYGCTAAALRDEADEEGRRPNNQSTFEYDPQHGGLLKETQPAVQGPGGQW